MRPNDDLAIIVRCSLKGCLVIDGRLRAWLEIGAGRHGVVAAFVGMPGESDTPLERLPATRLFASPDEARRWVESEARACGEIPIEWVEGDTAQ